MLRKLTLLLTIFVAISAAGQIETLPVKVINGVAFYYYEVPPKATIYSITRTYGVSREDLFKYNPQVIDGLRAGDTLLFPCQKETVAEQVATDATEPDNDIEQQPDNTATEEPAGEKKPEIETVVSEIAREEEAETAGTEPATEIADTTAAINVGVMLPFMLDSESVTRQAQNHTSFYRGILLAVNALANSERNINLFAFDTEGSADRLRNIMHRPEIQTLDFIIAPGDSLSIETIAATADTTEATVINLFAVKNDAHLRHVSVVQGNIPHDAMYARAVEAFCNEFKGKKALILNATDIPAEKREFTRELAESMLRAGIPYEQIDYSGKLMPEDLNTLPVRDYVCVPTSSSREALMKILPTLTEFCDANPTIDMQLYGYPEWVVIRGEVKEKLHRMNATVYSRFSTDLDGADVSAVNRDYTKWYGEEPQQSLPDVMLLGYDTVAWLLNGYNLPYTGLQNSFKIVELDDAGDVNEGLYLINFTRTGRVDAHAL